MWHQNAVLAGGQHCVLLMHLSVQLLHRSARYQSLLRIIQIFVILQVRSKLDPSFSAPNPPQDVVSMSAAYAAYMATSSNFRCLFRTLELHARIYRASFLPNDCTRLAPSLGRARPCRWGWLRYQLVAGVIEERGIEVLVHNQLLRTVLSFGIRTGNTFVGYAPAAAPAYKLCARLASMQFCACYECGHGALGSRSI